MKGTIKLNESQLRHIIKESLNTILCEEFYPGGKKVGRVSQQADPEGLLDGVTEIYGKTDCNADLFIVFDKKMPNFQERMDSIVFVKKREDMTKEDLTKINYESYKFPNRYWPIDGTVTLSDHGDKVLLLLLGEMANLNEETEERLDKYGNPIPQYGQGWGKDSSLMNRQGYNQDGSKGPWFSRSVAVATAVILKDTEDGNFYILANQRGNGTPDYQGYWNLPCGYLDYNEEAEDAAKREVYEETGIELNNIAYFTHSTSPDENRQNVVFLFVSFLEGSKSDYAFSTDNMEENEVSGIQWVPIDKVDTIRWAFNHDELIQKILSKYSFKINGEQSFNNKREILNKAIELLETGGDTEYVISLLKRI